MKLIIPVLLLLVILFFVGWLPKKKKKSIIPMPSHYRDLLNQQVPFYRRLDSGKQKEFEERMMLFLSSVRITGVKTTVEDLDKVLIAASALIPIFNFEGWEYVNLHEVLLYPDAFAEDFAQQGSQRHILGMVGSGALNHVMILSQSELRQAFINTSGKSNAAIHEFVHLVDKTDGSVDGVPGFIMDQKYIVPWLQLMHHEIQLIREEHSDINPYGATNEEEFFAVVSEYFFERPELLKEKHPALYDLLQHIFRQPASIKS
ncbi:MAG: peptidase [Terrimonas sp.]|nr:peptidase [Terrimonas sp.]